MVKVSLQAERHDLNLLLIGSDRCFSCSNTALLVGSHWNIHVSAPGEKSHLLCTSTVSSVYNWPSIEFVIWFQLLWYLPTAHFSVSKDTVDNVCITMANVKIGSDEINCYPLGFPTLWSVLIVDPASALHKFLDSHVCLTLLKHLS